MGRAVVMERLEERSLLAGDLGTISGHTWRDGNGNGLQDPGETERAAGTVFLDLNSTGTFDTGEPIAVASLDGNYVFAGLNPGTYTVRHLIGSDSALSYPMAASQFNIALSFADDIPENIRAGVRQAADRWMKIIVGDLPDEGGIDDISIDVQSGQLAENILATGGPDQFRSGSNLPYHGVVTWADVGLNESTIRATDIAMHEIAHVLGFGTMWQNQKLVETQLGAPVYTGQAALAMYRFAVDSKAAGVPIQLDADDATAGSHWASSWAAVNDSVFDVMASYLSQNVGGRFISTVTVAAMQDLGYQVNYSQGDLDWPSTKDKYAALRKDAPVSPDGQSFTVTLAAGQVQAGLDFGVKGASVTFPSGPKPVLKGTLSGNFSASTV